MTTAIQLEAGKLYQVKHWEKGWIIAEYVKEIPAHSYKYHNLDMMSMKVSNEKTRNVPDAHQWKKIRWSGNDSWTLFTVNAKGMEVRPVTPEAIQTITDLKAEIGRLDAERTARMKELREFCE